MTRKLTAYDDNFEQARNDSGIFLLNEGPNPRNWEELKNRLGQRRPSLQPSLFSEWDFKSFRQKNKQAGSEAQVMSIIFPIIRGDAAILSGQNRLFKNLKPLNNDFVTARPDFYDGSRPSDLDLRVRKDLGRYILPFKKLNALTFPNFFMEAKASRERCFFKAPNHSRCRIRRSWYVRNIIFAMVVGNWWWQEALKRHEKTWFSNKLHKYIKQMDRMPLFIPYIGGPYCRRMEGRRGAAKLQL